MTATPLVRVKQPADGWVRLILDKPPANILTMAMCDAVERTIDATAARSATKLISIEGAGAHFSYGASVEEHAPDRVAEMLPAFHRLIATLLSAPCPTAAIVQGRCFGGALEVVLACDLVFASDDARMGLPEIQLGVFPPAAAALLPLRIGAARATRVILSGEALSPEWWDEAGLLARPVSPSPLLAARSWFDMYLAPRSSVALRHAARASRAMLRDQALATLRTLEHQYLEELMASQDAVEGCAAFVAKRAPVWRNC